MDDRQRETIEKLRRQGLGYKAIAKVTDLSRDSVRHYCQRVGLIGQGRMLARMHKEGAFDENIGYGMESTAHQ